MSNTIDVETVPAEPAQAQAQPQTMALATRAEMAVGKALTVQELHQRLEYVREVMRNEMREGTDYGKIPGTGDKPSLLQPGAQKLLMTFNLRAHVLRETLRELPHPSVPGHREYEFTLRIFPAGGDLSLLGTDGVGNCSTLESKYRYRKAERKCPSCGKPAIIAGKEEYGGGFICWKKKNGCGEKFAANDARITGQPADDVENEDPADVWNTVRKIAFKRALVHGVINFTNTSELWTQDVEDMAGNEASRPKRQTAQSPAQSRPAQTQTAPRQSTPAPAAAASAHTGKAPPRATAETLKWTIQHLSGCRELATEYFQKLHDPAVLLPNEALEDLPLRFVPISIPQLTALRAAITDFGNGGEAKHAYPPNLGPDDAPPPAESKGPPRRRAASKPAAATPAPAPDKKDPDWFWSVSCPIPHKGQKKADYDQNPDTVRSLYEAMKGGDDAAQRRLWGFAHHWDPQPRQVGDKTYPVTAADTLFREALDAFVDWHERNAQSTPDDAPDPNDDLAF